MIPRKIHYCWFGNNKKDDLMKQCLDTWKKHLPNYEIIEWNEINYPIQESRPYVQKMYSEKKWAFVSDYARLDILYRYGGIYLDTDMYVLKSLDTFLENECFLGKESDQYINAAIIGATAGNSFIKKCKALYDNNPNIFKPIPKIITDFYKKNPEDFNNVKIYETEYFYPFSAKNIATFNPMKPPENAYAVHMWNYSWGNPYNKFLIKIGMHDLILKIVTMLGIKDMVKKIFNIAN